LEVKAEDERCSRNRDIWQAQDTQTLAAAFSFQVAFLQFAASDMQPGSSSGA
jgi:hypothetical protein